MNETLLILVSALFIGYIAESIRSKVLRALFVLLALGLYVAGVIVLVKENVL